MAITYKLQAGVVAIVRDPKGENPKEYPITATFTHPDNWDDLDEVWRSKWKLTGKIGTKGFKDEFPVNSGNGLTEQAERLIKQHAVRLVRGNGGIQISGRFRWQRSKS